MRRACSPSSILSTGMPVHLETTAAMSSSVTSSRRKAPCVCASFSSAVLGGERLLQLRHAAEPQLRGAVQITAPLRLLCLGAPLLDVLLQLADLADQGLFALPDALHGVDALAQLRHLLDHGHQPLGAGFVLFLAQRLLLDGQSDQSPFQLIDGLRQRIDLHLQAAGRLVHQIDGLVRELSGRDVAIGQARRRHQRRVPDANAVVDLVAFLQAAQDGHGVGDRRLTHEHRLEPPLQRLVLLHALAVLVQRRRADAPQLAARQRRLEHVGGVHGALRRRPPPPACAARR